MGERQQRDQRTEEGQVLSWRNTFGFARSARGDDVLVHFTSIVAEPGAYRKLLPGQRISFFRVQDGQGRWRAQDVRIISGGMQ